MVDLKGRDPWYWQASDGGSLIVCGRNGDRWRQPRPAFGLAGLEFASSRVGGDFLWDLLVPYRLLTPAFWLAAGSRGFYVRRRCRRLGVCLRCGYELRGDASGKCSECGEPMTNGGRLTA